MQVIDFSAREKITNRKSHQLERISNAEISPSPALKVKDKGVRLVGFVYRCLAVDWRAVAR